MTARKTGLTRRNPAEFGTVEERGGRYRALYRVKGRVIRAPKTFEMRPAARLWLAEQERALRGGTWIDPRLGAETVGGFAENWLAGRTDLAPRTREFYRHALDLFVLPHLGSIELAALTPARVSAWRSTCLVEARERMNTALPSKENPVRAWALAEGLQIAATGRIPARVREQWLAAGSPVPGVHKRSGDGSAAVAAAYRVLKTILTVAEQDDMVPKNPCRLRNASSIAAKERTPATPEQVEALAGAMPERYQAAVIVAAWSGLRSGELRALARRHIDLENGAIRVERSVVEVGGQRAAFGPTKTAGSRRTVALPAFVVDVLRAHIVEFVGEGDDTLVFATRDGGILSRHHLNSTFSKAREAVGIVGLRWHDLRHTGASLAYAVGASVPDVQRRLGHSTMRAAAIYAHSYADTDRVLADRLTAAFGGEGVAA